LNKITINTGFLASLWNDEVEIFFNNDKVVFLEGMNEDKILFLEGADEDKKR